MTEVGVERQKYVYNSWKSKVHGIKMSTKYCILIVLPHFMTSLWLEKVFHCYPLVDILNKLASIIFGGQVL